MTKELFFDKDLGLELLNWHISQWDPVYAAGSSIFSGRAISEELRDDAQRSLRIALNETKLRSHKRELNMLIKSLDWPEDSIEKED